MERALNAEERKTCWNTRDVYFKCLEKNNEDKEQCKIDFKKFEETCPKAWVKYFGSKRTKDLIKKKLETEGAVYNDKKR